MSLKRRTPPVVLPDISEKASQPAILKKDLPDELYPGAPIAGAGSEAPTPQAEEAAAQKLPAEVSEETTKKVKSTKDKIATGTIIFRVLFPLNIYFMYDFFRKSFSSFVQMKENGISEETITSLLKMTLFFAPLFFFVVLAVFMRMLIGCSTGKDTAEFIAIMTLFQYFVKAAYFGKAGSGIFLSALAISASLSEAILTYDGGGFFRHIARQIKRLWTKFIPKGL